MRAFTLGVLMVALVVLSPAIVDGQKRSGKKDMTPFAGTWELDNAYASSASEHTWVINVAELQIEDREDPHARERCG